jgi:hypothetical protein
MIIVKLKGGMGNQMFQYAFARALSLEKKMDLKLDISQFSDLKSYPDQVPRNYGLQIFNINEQFATKKDIKSYVPYSGAPVSKPGVFIKKGINKLAKTLNKKYLREPNMDKFDDSFLKDREMPSECYIDGLWISEKYFSSFADVIKKEFTYKFPLPEKEKKLAEYINQVDSVCVHVRRTDFLNDPRQITLPPELMYNGIEYLVKKAGIDPVIFVFSDDPKWCSENLKFNYKTIFINEENAGSDSNVHFQLMRQCHHFIISVSTFSWWAAWLADYPQKIVLHPHNYNSSDWSGKGWVDLSTIG